MDEALQTSLMPVKRSTFTSHGKLSSETKICAVIAVTIRTLDPQNKTRCQSCDHPSFIMTSFRVFELQVGVHAFDGHQAGVLNERQAGAFDGIRL